MAELARIVYLFGFALLMALVEIEIEGPWGWAEKLPTWYRVEGAAARLYGRLMSGKPLTGYHAFMLVLPLFAFHLPFVEGLRWSWAAEARLLASYMLWMVAWDLLWFLFNPAYGWRHFRRGQIWWHNRAWIGRFPIDYYNGVGASLLVAASAWLDGRSLAVLGEHARLCAGFAILTAAAAAYAPAYQRWYARMRTPGTDARAEAGIFHKQ